MPRQTVGVPVRQVLRRGSAYAVVFALALAGCSPVSPDPDPTPSPSPTVHRARPVPRRPRLRRPARRRRRPLPSRWPWWCTPPGRWPTSAPRRLAGWSPSARTGGRPSARPVAGCGCPASPTAPRPMCCGQSAAARTCWGSFRPPTVDPSVRVLTVGGRHPLRDPKSYSLQVPAAEPAPAVTNLTIVGDVMLGRRVGRAIADDPRRSLPAAGRPAVPGPTSPSGTWSRPSPPPASPPRAVTPSEPVPAWSAA